MFITRYFRALLALAGAPVAATFALSATPRAGFPTAMMHIFRHALLLSLLATSAAFAQTAPTPATTQLCATVSGHVLGNGQPLAGATVTVEGTRKLAITNGEGFFTLSLEAVPHPKLVFSAAGYETQSMALTNCNAFDIELPLLPGTRIKQRGKRKGFIMKTGTQLVTPLQD